MAIQRVLTFFAAFLLIILSTATIQNDQSSQDELQHIDQIPSTDELRSLEMWDDDDQYETDISVLNNSNYIIHYDKASPSKVALIQQYLKFNTLNTDNQFYGEWKALDDDTEEVSQVFESMDINSGDASINIGIINVINSLENAMSKDEAQVSSIQVHESELYIFLRIFNGRYIDDWVQMTIEVKNSEFVDNVNISEGGLRINQTVKVVYGKYFDTQNVKSCLVSFLLARSDQVLKVNIEQSTCFPVKFSLEFKTSADGGNSSNKDLSNSIMCYCVIASGIIALYIFCIRKEIRRCRSNEAITRNVSSFSIECQAAWTFTMLPIHFLMLMQYQKYTLFFMPVFVMLCIAHFGFQTRLLMNLWQFDNTRGQYDFANHYCSEMFKIFTKFYFTTFILLIMFLKIMIIEDLYLTLVFAFVWIPQIAWNFIKRQRRSPSLMFAHISTLMHVFFPVYVRYIDGNFLYLRPQHNTIEIILLIQAVQLVIMTFQRIFGARFCFPKRFRSFICNGYKPHQYRHRFEAASSAHGSSLTSSQLSSNNTTNTTNDVSNNDAVAQEEESTSDIHIEECVICMNDLRIDIVNNNTIMSEFMMTPCNHKFHESCLKNWMDIKQECPTCRRELPLIPREEEDEY